MLTVLAIRQMQQIIDWTKRKSSFGDSFFCILAFLQDLVLIGALAKYIFNFA